MARGIILLITSLFLFTALPVMAADVTLQWDAQADATGFRIYRSVDAGITWTMAQEVGNVTETTLTGQPDTGIVLYRAAAYNGNGESIRRNAGAWFWNDAPQPPSQPTGTGVN